MNLFDRYKEKTDWKSYYNITIDIDQLFCDNQNDNEKYDSEKCREFIKKHFTNGCKKAALNFDFYEDRYASSNDENDFRHTHMISLYLLGLSLSDAFDDALKRKLNELIDNLDEWYDFKYTWFLACLYHDTASFIEKDGRTVVHGDDSLSIWKEKSHIEHTIYNHNPLKESAKLTRFPEQLVEDYFSYRKKEDALDHGIVSGYMLFDKLKKNFIEKTKGEDLKPGEQVIKNSLSWRLEHLDHFAYIADAIVCHNMWTTRATDNTNSLKYRCHNLNELIIKNSDDRLGLNDFPLQFMLCLLDTIEPVKKFENQMSAREVLKNINISNQGNGHINISWTDKIKEHIGFFEWQKSISTLKDWLKVNVSTCERTIEGCQIIIDIL